MEEPYFVEIDNIGCATCGARKTWGVVGPDGVMLSSTWEDEEQAAWIAEILNDAYAKGKANRKSRKGAK